MSKIFIYKDGDYPLDVNNIFLSTEYKCINDFLKQNKDDNFVPLYTYETECVFEKTIKILNKKINKLEKENKKMKDALMYHRDETTLLIGCKARNVLEEIKE